jgi:tRNA dimethylallyltransferase
MLNNSSIEGIAIAGATASGKSALALSVAKRRQGLIINADSAQVYADLRILTARPSPEDEKCAPHALYGVIDGASAFSAAEWARKAAQIVSQTIDHRLPILVGGSGLYFRALFEGLASIPPIPDGVRQKWRKLAQEVSPQELHHHLQERDPITAARLMKTDKQRIVRALEVLEVTGRGLADIQKKSARPLLDPSKWLRIVLNVEKAELEERIRRRLSHILESGAIDEVKTLLSRKLDSAQPVMKAIGVPELAAYHEGLISLQEAGDKILQATRQYAKRQETWFRNQTPQWQRVKLGEVESFLAGL